MGRSVVGVVACLLAAPAHAQPAQPDAAQPMPAAPDSPTTNSPAPASPTTPAPEPQPQSLPAPAPAARPPVDVRPAPPERSWYSTLAPANVTEQQIVAAAPFQRAVSRGGLVALAGITRTLDASFARLDLGVPTSSRQSSRLRVLLVTELRYGEDGAADARDLVLTPELQYDWRLPFGSSDVEVVFVLGTGIMWSRHWVRLPDEPYWPSSWESSTELAFRVECAFQYRRRDGLVISVHPLSAAFPLNNPEPPDARWMDVESDKRISVSVLAGYQFK